MAMPATGETRILVPVGALGSVAEGKELPSYAFPFSPAGIERGQVFEFHLNHVVAVDSPFELMCPRWVETVAGADHAEA